MKSVDDQMKPTPQRLAALLDEVMITEHAYLQVERLAVLADEPLSDAARHIIIEKIAAAIESASTLTRIAYRFELIARTRIVGSQMLTSQEALERQGAFEEACCTALEVQLAKLRRSDPPRHLARSSIALVVYLVAVSDDFAAV